MIANGVYPSNFLLHFVIFLMLCFPSLQPPLLFDVDMWRCTASNRSIPTLDP